MPDKSPPGRHRVANSAVEVGPLGHVAIEASKLGDHNWDKFSVRPCSPTIGAEIGGLDLAGPLDEAVAADLRSALAAYKVLFFRDQPLTPAEHVTLTGRFGSAGIHPLLSSDAAPDGVERHERSTDVSGTENVWHRDLSWRPVPPAGAILHAITVPSVGGDTLFADMAAAHDGLDEAVQDHIAGLTATHNFTRVIAHEATPERLAEVERDHPPTHHPLVITHPVTSRRVLNVNRYFVECIDGLEPDESDRLLAELCALADRPEYQCRFGWEQDSVAVWDNCSVQHYACSDYWPAPRVAERTLITELAK